MKFISPAKKVLLCCLCLIMLLAVPIASQAQTRLDNPTAAQLDTCGLPATYAGFTSASSITTFNMTADCTFSSSNVQTGWPFLRFESGEFTINGNGFSITGPTNGYAIIVGLPGADTTTVLNLNDVTIQGAGRQNALSQAIVVQRGARLNGRNIIFRENRGAAAIMALQRGKAYLEDVQFISNSKTFGSLNLGSAVSVLNGTEANAANTVMSITNAVFEGHTAVSSPFVLSNHGGTLILNGCIVDRNNQGGFIYTAPDGVTTDNRGSCATKKKKEKVPTAVPTSTPRPQIAATHVALQAATGATFRAAYGLDSGVHFRQLDGAGIGVQSIIDAGYLEAFDVWGYVEQGVEVCFPQVGRVIFLDARASPRAIVPLESTVVNGQTCVSINSPGSLVLLPQ